MAATAKGLSDEKAACILADLQGGQTFRHFGISKARWEVYLTGHADYAAQARPLIVANAQAAQLRKGAAKRALTHCKYGHPLSGENLYLAPGRRERKCLACLKRRDATERRMSEEQARRVVDALHNGQTISDITGAGKTTYILNHRALLLFRKKHPKYDRIVLRLSSVNAKIHHAEAFARRAQILRAPAIAERGLDIFNVIRSAVPLTLPTQIRDDVIGAMALEIVEGKLRPTDVRRRVREYIALQFRQFTKYGRFSLDAQLFEDGSATLLDRLSTEAGTGYWDVNMMASTGRRK
jgi:hypothetical protein